MPNTPPLLLIPSKVPLFVLLQAGHVGEPMQLSFGVRFRVLLYFSLMRTLE